MSIFSMISLLLILLLAGFMSTQGAYSSLLSLIGALFSSVLAMGAGHAAARMIPASWLEYADGLGFFAVFVVALVVLRVISDMAFPKNVGLPKWPDLIAGGVVGFFTGMIIIGTLTIGLEMMPFGTSILGAPTITESSVEGRSFSASFVSGMYYMTNGGSLGGTKLASVHPDLGGELTRKRHTARASVRQTLPQQFVGVTAAYYASNDRMTQFKREEPSPFGQSLIVRTKIEQGNGQNADAESSFDLGEGHTTSYFDITPAQVRMVCQKGGSYLELNPVGYLDKGNVFVKMGLSGRQVVDSKGNVQKDSNGVPSYEPLEEDYKDQVFEPEKDQAVMEKSNANQAIIPSPSPSTAEATSDLHPLVFIDWVFDVPDGATPLFMELKRGGMVSLGGEIISPDKVYQPLAAIRYPPREDRANQPVITVAVKLNGTPIKGAQVWVLKPTIVRRDYAVLLTAAKNNLEENTKIEVSSPWPNNPSDPGVPPKSTIDSAYRISVDEVESKSLDTDIEWKYALQVLFYGNVERNGRTSIKNLADYFDNKLGAKIEASPGKLVSTKTNANGKTDPITIPVGRFVVIVVAQTSNSFHVWMVDQSLDKKAKAEYKLPGNGPANGGVSEFAIDLTPKSN